MWNKTIRRTKSHHGPTIVVDTVHTHTHSQSSDGKAVISRLLKSQSKKKYNPENGREWVAKPPTKDFITFSWEVNFQWALVSSFFLFFLRKKARLPRWCYVRQVKSEVHNPLAQRLDTGQIVLQISSCLGDRHIEGWAAVQCSFHILPSKRSMGTPWTLQCDRVLSHRPSLSIELDPCAPLGQGCHC